MKNYFYIYLCIIILSTLFSGCSNRKIIINNNEVKQYPGSSGEEKTDPSEDVKTADLDRKISNSQTTHNKISRIPFPVNEYRNLSLSGRGVIKGSIFVTNKRGKTIVGKATRLYLNPLTSYSSQWYNKSYISGKKMKKADTRLYNYLRFTMSNENGQYAFYGVPSGKYYLIGSVLCGSECGFANPKQIRIAKEVHIRGPQIINSNLSRKTN